MDGRSKEARKAKDEEAKRQLVSSFYYHMQSAIVNGYNWSKEVCIDRFFKDQEYERQAYQGMFEYENEIWRHNRRLLRAIKKVKGNTFYKYLLEIIRSCEKVVDKMKVEKKPGGEWQKERYGQTITGIWVDQWSIGTEGDSWSGYVWVQLKENKYLKISYSM